MENSDRSALTKLISRIDNPPAHLVDQFIKLNSEDAITGEIELAQLIKVELLLKEGKVHQAFLGWEQAMRKGLEDSLVQTEGARILSTIATSANEALQLPEVSMDAILAYECLHQIGQTGLSMSVIALRWYTENDRLNQAETLANQLMAICPNFPELRSVVETLENKKVVSKARQERNSDEIQ